MKTQKGITLIALIITIIVMLILVGVSVSVVLNTGLFKAAQGAAKNTESEKVNETALSNGTINIGGIDISINDYTDRLSAGIPVELQIGDIIEYTPASEYYDAEHTYDVSSTDEDDELKLAGCTGSFYTDLTAETVEWKVIGVQGNTIKIIPNAVSSGDLEIYRANGWNNCIDALNSVCGAIYGNTTSDKYTATAKSLTVEDINGITGYTPTPSRDSFPASGYGEYNYFPTTYLDEKGVENYTEKTEGCGYAANSSITVDTTNYYYLAENRTRFNLKFANWVNLGSGYWLASRCVEATSDVAGFGVRHVDSDGVVSDGRVFDSDQDENNPSFAVRPVVSLTPTVTPTLVDTYGEGDNKINYWAFKGE